VRAILHIGAEKTATTTLQQFLYRNRAVLAARGVALTDTAGHPNNRKLAAFALSPGRTDDYFRNRGILTAPERAAFVRDTRAAFEAEVAALPGSVHSVVLTGEHMHSRLTDAASVQRLRGLLAPLFPEIRVVCYVREQAAVVQSLYSTAIRAGHDIGFDSFVQGCTPDKPRYNYHASLSLWAAVFGADRVQARLFDKVTGGDICADFRATLDALAPEARLDAGAFDPVPAPLNRALGACGLELGRMVNAVLGRGPQQRAIMAALERSELAGQGVLAFPRAPAIHAAFDASNRAFAQAFLGRADSPFAPLRPRAAEPVTPQDLMALWAEVRAALEPTPKAAQALRAITRRIEAAVAGFPEDP
jgi:hypothetical protein